MYCLIYMSRAIAGFKSEAAEELLKIARSRNAERNISGCLLFDGTFFLQIIEGDKEDIDALYKKISADQRHHEIDLLFYNRIEERLFPDWKMGYYQWDAKEDEIDGALNLERARKSLLNIEMVDRRTQLIRSIIMSLSKQ